MKLTINEIGQKFKADMVTITKKEVVIASEDLLEFINSLTQVEDIAPPPPAALPEAPTAPDPGRSGGSAAADKRRRAAAAGGGGRSTILTGARGVQDGASTVRKTLLGQ